MCSIGRWHEEPEPDLTCAAAGERPGAALGLFPPHTSRMPVASSGLLDRPQVGILTNTHPSRNLSFSSKSGRGPGSFMMKINGVTGLG